MNPGNSAGLSSTLHSRFPLGRAAPPRCFCSSRLVGRRAVPPGDRNDVLGGTRPGCGRRPAIRNQEPRKEVMKNTEIPALGRAAGYRVDERARLAGISVRSLQRRFASQFCSAPHQWLNALRLHDAKQLLKSGCSVKETASTLGYSDTSHFSRDFASLYGLCPIDFARNHPARRRNVANGHDFGAFGHGEGLYNDAQVVQ
jgi:AraC-like DNA-binding protein